MPQRNLYEVVDNTGVRIGTDLYASHALACEFIVTSSLPENTPIRERLAWYTVDLYAWVLLDMNEPIPARVKQ